MTEVTRPDEDVERLISAIPDAVLRDDCRRLVAMMSEATATRGRLWGPNLVGFGRYHYRYASGREGDGCTLGFSQRPRRLTIYRRRRVPRLADCAARR